MSMLDALCEEMVKSRMQGVYKLSREIEQRLEAVTEELERARRDAFRVADLLNQIAEIGHKAREIKEANDAREARGERHEGQGQGEAEGEEGLRREDIFRIQLGEEEGDVAT